MAIDPVAVYAAVVATGALGWQVYKWRLDRAGRLDVALHQSWVSEQNPFVLGSVYNSNDYAVKLDRFAVTISREKPRGVPRRGLRWGNYSESMGYSLSLEAVGLPPEIPAHDSVGFHFDGKAKWSLCRGDRVTVTVVNSLHHEFSAGASVREDPPWMRLTVVEPAEASGAEGDVPADAIPPIEPAG